MDSSLVRFTRAAPITNYNVRKFREITASIVLTFVCECHKIKPIQSGSYFSLPIIQETLKCIAFLTYLNSKNQK
jgi:hypothetical protein